MWNGQVLQVSYPELHCYTNSENITLSKVLNHEFLDDIFNLPLPEEAYIKYC
jgi:hypothetical protein